MTSRMLGHQFIECASLRIARPQLRHFTYENAIFVSFDDNVEIPLHG